MFSDLKYRLRAIFRRNSMERELDSELRFHLERQIEKYVQSGMEPEEAARRARLQLGGVAQMQEECRDARGVSLFERTIQDLRYALRMLRNSPGFTFVAAFTLALGIGANVAIFSVLYAVILQPFPYEDPDRLILLGEQNAEQRSMPVSWMNFQDYKAARSFESIAAYRRMAFTLAGEPPTRIIGREISASFFAALRIRPLRGRGLTEADEKPESAPVALISEASWLNRFNSDPAILERSVQLNGTSFALVGVIATDEDWLKGDEVFVPIARNDVLPGWRDRGNHQGITVLGRLSSGVSIEAARTEMNDIGRVLEKEHSATNSGVRPKLTVLRESVVGDTRLALVALASAVGLLVLIACANVANLLLARSSARRRELGIRTALGASRGRLVRQLCLESLLLALVGGTFGLLVGAGGIHLIQTLAPENLPRLANVGLNIRVLEFTLLLSMSTAAIFGIVPGMHILRGNAQDLLRQSGTSTAARDQQRTRKILLAMEVGLVVVLSISAGLAIRSLVAVQRSATGFDSTDVLVMSISIPNTRYATQEARTTFFEAALTDIRNLPGITSAGLALSPPLRGGNWGSVFVVEGQPIATRAETPSAEFNVITPDYLQTIKAPVSEGRTFTDQDRSDSPRVVLVNRSLAKRFWPNESAIGKRIKQGWADSDSPWRTVVGVVEDIKQYDLEASPRVEVFLPYAQTGMGTMGLVVRSSATTGLLDAIRARINHYDAAVPIYNVQSLNEVIEDSVASRKVAVWLLTVFSGVALLLALTGVYGVVAYWMSLRRREIGIRIAFGGAPKDIYAVAFKQHLPPLVIGLVFGIGGALAVGRAMASLLYGITGTDPVTFASMSLAVMLTTILACALPAHRALRSDPVSSLRTD